MWCVVKGGEGPRFIPSLLERVVQPFFLWEPRLASQKENRSPQKKRRNHTKLLHPLLFVCLNSVQGWESVVVFSCFERLSSVIKALKVFIVKWFQKLHHGSL